MQRLTKSQILFYGETEAKRARICSTTRWRADSKSIEELSKACKGSPSLKACFMARQKPNVPGSARPRDGEQTPKQSKNFLRHAKAHQVSKLVLWRDRSKACQDLLDHATASRTPSIGIFSKACKGSSNLKVYLWRDQRPSMPGPARPREGEQSFKHRRIF